VRRINCFALVVLSALLCVPLPAGVRAADIPVPDGYLDALGWYGRAAESGDSEAQYYLAPISQVNSIFDALIWRFCYKNQYVEVLMEWFAWHTRWVNRNGTAFGSILTAA
jgi:hypothetical protein